MNPIRLLVAALALAVPDLLLAHGGQYRGPGSVVPPTSRGPTGSGASASPSPTPGGGGTSGSGSGSAATPNTGGAQPPGGAASAGPTVRGAPLDDDLTRWEFWWEFEKDPFLRLRESMHDRKRRPLDEGILGIGGEREARDLLPPTRKIVDEEVVPALVQALGATDNRDTLTGCMVALAKIGRAGAATRLGDLFAARLRSHDQEVRETAALCLGIARTGDAADIDLLLALQGDTAAGRQACGRSSVDERTRAFALYGLGLTLPAVDVTARAVIVRAVAKHLDAPAGTGRNLRVAAIAALAQLGQDDAPAHLALRDFAISALADYYRRELGPGEQLVQAHCPPAIARLTPAMPAHGPMRQLFADDLLGSLTGRMPDGRPAVRSNHHVAQSAALALGEMTGPWEADDSPDAPFAKLLVRAAREHRDHQTRYFALLALGRVGGDRARDFLLDAFDRSGRAVEKPWIALALGTLVAERHREAERRLATPEPDPRIGKALTEALASEKNPGVVGATAIALGLCRHRGAADTLRALLREHVQQDDLAGQLAIALALLDADRARIELRQLLPRTYRRPQLLMQVAMALGRMGDVGVVDELTTQLSAQEGGLARLSAIASALGQIGDRRSLPPLLAMLHDETLTPLTRAFAAVALGSICDKDPLPWNATFAHALNYRAAVETLTDGQAGILDIL